MRAGSIFGHRVLRSEDPALLTGAARYTEDLPMEGAAHAVFVRSPLAHARIEGVDATAAGEKPGVIGIFRARDLGFATPSKAFGRPKLADDKIRFQGEPIAVVVAETRAGAIDAAEAVIVDYEPLEVVVDPEAAARDDAPLLFEEAGTNVVWRLEEGRGSVSFEDADVVVRGRFVNQRLIPVPLEVNGTLAAPSDDGDGLKLWLPCQDPFSVRDNVAEALGLDNERVRVIAPAVGGGFGAKISTYPEQIVVAALALRLGRPVRYVETRSENQLAMGHGRAQVQEIEIGARADGSLTALRARIVQDGGAYPDVTGELPELTYEMASGTYRIPAVEFSAISVATNTTETVAYRGAGRPEAAAMVERAVDLVARELNLDPVEVRRRNLLDRDAFPYDTPTGAHYDSGDYKRALEAALQLAGYDDLRAEQKLRRERGDVVQLGIGVSCYVEVTGFNPEFGSVEVDSNGLVTVLTGVSPHGQGHETSLAQIASGVLGIPFEAVKVVHSDTALVPQGGGTMGSRSLQKGGSAVFTAGNAVLDKARRIAAHELEVSVDDVVLSDGRLEVAGVPERSMTWAEVAAGAADPARLPSGEEPGLVATTEFQAKRNTSFPFGTHVAVVEVDTEIGEARLQRHIAVDDCGRILNPMMVEGQQHGGIAQGVAQALFEQAVYDDTGNLITGNLATYAMPSARELPPFETANTETPTPLNPLGAKGIGESATIGSTPAVQNAVVDALAHLGVTHIDMPLTPERVWRAITEAKA